MNKKKILVIGSIVFIALISTVVGVLIYFGRKESYEMMEFSYKTPARFEQENDGYSHIIAINDSNAIYINVMNNSNMTPMAYAEMKKFQMETDDSLDNREIKIKETEINGYETVLLTGNTNIDGFEIECYNYYIYAGEWHLEVLGIFEAKKADKYKKYVDEITDSVQYNGEIPVYSDIYEDDKIYLELQGKFKAEKVGGADDLINISIQYINAEQYERGFSKMRIKELTDVTGDLEQYVKDYCEQKDATMSEGILLDKYDCFIAYETIDLQLLNGEKIQYYFEENGVYYCVIFVIPVGDEECMESYLEVLESLELKE